MLMGRLESARQAQRFLALPEQISASIRPRRVDGPPEKQQLHLCNQALRCGCQRGRSRGTTGIGSSLLFGLGSGAGPRLAQAGLLTQRLRFILDRELGAAIKGGGRKSSAPLALQEVGRVRAGINSRNIATSRDGRWLAVANYLPRTLTILSTEDLSVPRVFEVTGLRSDGQGRHALPRLGRLPGTDARQLRAGAEGRAGGLGGGHLSRRRTGLRRLRPQLSKGMVEAVTSSEGLFAHRRIEVDEPIDDFFFDPSYDNLIGATRDGARGVVVNLDVRREIAELLLPGMPHLGSGITWERDGRRIWVRLVSRSSRSSTGASSTRSKPSARGSSCAATGTRPISGRTCSSARTATGCT